MVKTYLKSTARDSDNSIWSLIDKCSYFYCHHNNQLYGTSDTLSQHNQLAWCYCHGKAISKVSSCFFFFNPHYWKTFKGYLELRCHRLFWAPRQLCSCYWQKKSLAAQGQRGRKALGTIWEGAQIGIHCLNVVQSGPSYPPHHHHHHTPPPSQQQTSDRMQSRAGWHFICVSVCVQWHGCRGFEIIWPGEEHINSRCQTGRMKWKCT